MKLVRGRPKYLKRKKNHYCSGCGHSIVHNLLMELVDELNIADRVLVVAPAGCAVLAYDYMDVDVVESAHGRGPAPQLVYSLLNVAGKAGGERLKAGIQHGRTGRQPAKAIPQFRHRLPMDGQGAPVYRVGLLQKLRQSGCQALGGSSALGIDPLRRADPVQRFDRTRAFHAGAIQVGTVADQETRAVLLHHSLKGGAGITAMFGRGQEGIGDGGEAPFRTPLLHLRHDGCQQESQDEDPDT